MAEARINQIFEMLNRMEEANKQTKLELTEIAEQTNVNLKQSNLELSEKLEQTKLEVSEKIDQTNINLESKIQDTNVKLDHSIEQVNEKLKKVVDKVKSIETRCSEMEIKIDDRYKALEVTLKQAFTEQVVSMDVKIKKHFTKCESKITVVQNECDKLSTVVTENRQSIDRLGTAVKDNELVTLTHHDKLLTIDQRFEQINKDFKTRVAPTVIYQSHVEDQERIMFRGNPFENPIEFLKMCEREMNTLGSELADNEKIDWVARHLKDSARQWYNVVRSKIATYTDMVQLIENRYWNLHIQSQLRDKLQYGKYNPGDKRTPEQYIIQQMERAIHLRPLMTEEEIVTKLAQHFSKAVKLAAFTQGVKTLDELLLLISQSTTYLNESPTHTQVVRTREDYDKPQGQTHRFWGTQDKNTRDSQKPQQYNKPYYKPNKNAGTDKKYVHSMTLETKTNDDNPKNGKSTEKKYYIFDQKNPQASTSGTGTQ